MAFSIETSKVKWNVCPNFLLKFWYGVHWRDAAGHILYHQHGAGSCSFVALIQRRRHLALAGLLFAIPFSRTESVFVHVISIQLLRYTFLSCPCMLRSYMYFFAHLLLCCSVRLQGSRCCSCAFSALPEAQKSLRIRWEFHRPHQAILAIFRQDEFAWTFAGPADLKGTTRLTSPAGLCRGSRRFHWFHLVWIGSWRAIQSVFSEGKEMDDGVTGPCLIAAAKWAWIKIGNPSKSTQHLGLEAPWDQLGDFSHSCSTFNLPWMQHTAGDWATCIVLKLSGPVSHHGHLCRRGLPEVSISFKLTDIWMLVQKEVLQKNGWCNAKADHNLWVPSYQVWPIASFKICPSPSFFGRKFMMIINSQRDGTDFIQIIQQKQTFESRSTKGLRWSPHRFVCK